MELDKLTVGLIRSLQPRRYTEDLNDADLLAYFGRQAQPMADAIRQTIREEVVRALRTV
jgi:hypothetical protein